MIGLLKGIDKQNLSSFIFEQLKSLNNVVDNRIQRKLNFIKKLINFKRNNI